MDRSTVGGIRIISGVVLSRFRRVQTRSNAMPVVVLSLAGVSEVWPDSELGVGFSKTASVATSGGSTVLLESILVPNRPTRLRGVCAIMSAFFPEDHSDRSAVSSKS